ncbi:39S ribosomal protein L38 [Blattella germanica]|nr:39S ribosomal protein L38 [Blattella germanica]
MAAPLLKLYIGDVRLLQLPCVRFGHWIRGKSPLVARNLKQRLEGLPHRKPSRSQEFKERITFLRNARSNPEMERMSRKQELKIPLAEVKKEWQKTAGPFQLKAIAEHYGVYEHLFGEAYFIPRVPLDIQYKQQDECYLPVYNGNMIKPTEAALAPEVKFESDPNSLWSLVLTNPDGHFTKEGAEYVHWFIGNIPGSDVGKGEVIWNYLQPFPPRGVGFQRLVFVLYKQDKKMDYSMLKKEGPCLRLEDRTFQTLDFYRERQDYITPAGLAFFQSDWDTSLTDFFHNVLSTYMDKYRDPKQINKEYLMRKLKKVHPFKTPDPPPRFPNAFPMDHRNIPSWLRLEMKKDRLRWGRINDM